MTCSVRDNVYKSEDKLLCTQQESFFFSNENINLGLFCADCLEPGKREAEGGTLYTLQVIREEKTLNPASYSRGDRH